MLSYFTWYEYILRILASTFFLPIAIGIVLTTLGYFFSFFKSNVFINGVRFIKIMVVLDVIVMLLNIISRFS